MNFQPHVLRKCPSQKKVFQKKIFSLELINGIDVIFLGKGNILLSFIFISFGKIINKPGVAGADL